MYTNVFGVVFALFLKQNHVLIYFCWGIVNHEIILLSLSLYIWIRNKNNSLCGALWRAYHLRSCEVRLCVTWAYQRKALEDLQLNSEAMCCFLVGLILWLSLGAMLSRWTLASVLIWHCRGSWLSVSIQEVWTKACRAKLSMPGILTDRLTGSIIGQRWTSLTRRVRVSTWVLEVEFQNIPWVTLDEATFSCLFQLLKWAINK